VRAWDCHRSQQNPDGAFAQMPDAVRRAMWENEHYVLAAARVPLPEGPCHDLFAGLDAWTSEPAPTADQVGAGVIGADNAGILRANLAVRRAYREIVEEYERSAHETQFKTFLQDLPEKQQEFIYLLARALRRADGAPGKVDPEPRVMPKRPACRSLTARSQFLLVAARHALARYQQLADEAVDDDLRATWEELLPLAREHLSAVESFAGALT
jgi:hypothetical protein